MIILRWCRNEKQCVSRSAAMFVSVERCRYNRQGRTCELEQETTKGKHNKRQPTNAGQQHHTSHKRQSPIQAAIQASNQHITPHPVPPRHLTQTQGHGTYHGRGRDPRNAHTTETKPPAPVMKPRHGTKYKVLRSNCNDRMQRTLNTGTNKYSTSPV